eukprot:15444367-Alexandrium_andersonii.AAC.1
MEARSLPRGPHGQDQGAHRPQDRGVGGRLRRSFTGRSGGARASGARSSAAGIPQTWAWKRM